MPALVEFPQAVAMVKGLQWTSDDAVLQAILQALVGSDGPSPSIPDPDSYEAHRAAETFGGTVLRDEPEESEVGVIY